MKKTLVLVSLLFAAGAMFSWKAISSSTSHSPVRNENFLWRADSEHLWTDEENVSESWMGVYMNGIKIGYSYSREYDFYKAGIKLRGNQQESLLRVSRLGGNPVSISTRQDSVCDAQGQPLETVLRTKMAASETVIKAEIGPDIVTFKSGEKVTNELPYEKPLYLGVPMQKIIEEGGLSSGNSFVFKMLEPLTQTLVDVSFEILEREFVLILGEKMNLWHVRSEMTDLMPVLMDEWVDDKGEVWKSISRASFLNTVSIRMSKEKALEMSEENLDIAFSVVIKSNVLFPDPQEVRSVSFKLSGIPIEKIAAFPFDGASLKLSEKNNEFAVIRTQSVIFSGKKAVDFPVREEGLEEYLQSTIFCQSDDNDIRALAGEIVGRETNSWTAAKKIAQWVNTEMKPNYDVGFASAREILENREGDCSEHTVIMVTLCRAVGIPARAAVGIMYGGGIFAYHMWPEVFVGRWVALDPKWLAVDKTSGEYYTDATHLKFGHSALNVDIFKEMGQAMSDIIGKLKLEVMDYFPK
ncbi:MAG: transglutaminase domain-containing protein [Candidatus Aminicenantes bacterium]|nr:transglutaminase domain-containing protein [Candidatus Aminicenantes bacterium]